MSPRPTALAAALAAVVLVPLCPASAAPLDERDCRLEREGLPAALARCSRLEVPADPAQPDGATLSLFVARVPSLTASPEPDPLVLVAGGPGQSTVDLYLQSRAAFAPARRDREIVLVDQRGTGRSAAGFECALPDEVGLETAAPDEIAPVVSACLDALEHDPRVYTTSVAVRDLDALRGALGVERWNLYGVSYGTRVVQHYVRRFPARVRAIVLDGVVPAELALGPDIAPNAQAALDSLFARCAAVAACAERFATLEADFAALRERLARAPVDVATTDLVSGEPVEIALSETELQAAVRLLSYNSLTAALLPLVIDEAHAGRYALLAAQAAWIIDSLNREVSFPMHNSVVCSEDVPFFGADDAGAAGPAYLGTAVVDSLAAICDRWPAGVIDDDFKSPVVSDAPALLLSGEFDPVTPPAYAERVIGSGLRNARHLVGRGQGHGLVGIGCVPRLLRDFLAAANPQSLDAACLEDEPPMPFFLSRQGPAP